MKGKYRCDPAESDTGEFLLFMNLPSFGLRVSGESGFIKKAAPVISRSRKETDIPFLLITLADILEQQLN
ncbi:hypothetical protein [Clostridium sp. KNHs216]|uniref:hypothetical protein n=1 Tax=Clostridium sp. KNHs216 TaxID=1550235 RepID=UPI0011535931|nr:hypothetical protein [Clostridium sp. KNHs216]